MRRNSIAIGWLFNPAAQMSAQHQPSEAELILQQVSISPVQNATTNPGSNASIEKHMRAACACTCHAASYRCGYLVVEGLCQTLITLTAENRSMLCDTMCITDWRQGKVDPQLVCLCAASEAMLRWLKAPALPRSFVLDLLDFVLANHATVFRYAFHHDGCFSAAHNYPYSPTCSSAFTLE